jgi:hypothetical protein
MAVGQVLDLGGGIQLEVLALEEKGALFWLTWERFSMLVPAGKVGKAWLQAPHPPEILLLPEDVSMEDFPLGTITDWSPVAILLPLEPADQPLEGEHELVQTLEGYPLITTLDHGWVRVSTDGAQVWVAAEH